MMRKNLFGENIAQPTDSHDDVVEAFMARFGEHPTFICADLESRKDDKFLFGGELFDVEHNGMTFDGFETLEAARKFAEQFVGADDIQVLD